MDHCIGYCIARPFYIGRFPVTQAQWLTVMGKPAAHYRGQPDLPADCVSWFAAQAFCSRLCLRLNRVF